MKPLDFWSLRLCRWLWKERSVIRWVLLVCVLISGGVWFGATGCARQLQRINEAQVRLPLATRQFVAAEGLGDHRCTGDVWRVRCFTYVRGVERQFECTPDGCLWVRR